MHFNEFVKVFKNRLSQCQMYIFYGEEELFKEEGTNLIKNAYPDRKVNTLRIYTADIDIAKLSQEIYTPPLLGKGKLLVLIDNSNFFGQNKDWIKTYLNNPSNLSVLILCTGSYVLESKLEPKTDKVKTVKVKTEVFLGNLLKEANRKYFQIIYCSPPKNDDLHQWIKTAIEIRGKIIDSNAIKELCNRCNFSLSLLNSYIEKLCLYLGKRNIITTEDIQQIIEPNIEYDAFKLAMVISEHKIAESIKILKNLLEKGENLQKIIGALAWWYRIMVEAKKLIDSGINPDTALSQLGIDKEWQQNQFLHQIKQYNYIQLKNKHHEILKTDLELKTTGESDKIISELLVYKLAS